MPLSVPFEVNDAALRQHFLSVLLPAALDPLEPSAAPVWGHMSPHQMVEHLSWAFDLSTGLQHTDCPVPEDQRERMKPFLFSNRPSPPDFANPVLASGLPPLQHVSLAEAKTALVLASLRFLNLPPSDPPPSHTHPVFGPINTELWSRSHFKHVFHHLAQFRLVAAA